MVAIVSGDSLGLALSSLATLGQQGSVGSSATGRNGQQAFVNAATGNLVLQAFDDRFDARGADITAVRTYNSQGGLVGGVAGGWGVGAMRQRLLIPANAQQAGSIMVRVDRDGAEGSYSWNASAAPGKYLTTAGAGAHDTIHWDAPTSQWVYTEGTSLLVERFDSTGKLVKSIDAEGNQSLYTYDGQDRISTVTAANQEVMTYTYNGAGDLDKVSSNIVGSAANTLVRYQYDGFHRLTKVTVDLTPADNSVADGKTYVTDYDYDSVDTTNRRIVGVRQSDGTSLTITYTNVSGVYKVATIKDALNPPTLYAYDTAARKTTLTDPAGRTSAYYHDTSNRLVRIDTGGAMERSFSYTSNGDVETVTDGAGYVSTFSYDISGNQIKVRDALGNTVDRAFTSQNQVATETVYRTPDPDGPGAALPGSPATTHFLYDPDPAKARQLRFVVSPEGRVTEYRYNSYGERTSELVYAVVPYPSASTRSYVNLNAWVAVAGNRAGLVRADMAYTVHGQLNTVTRYASVDVSGNGVLTGASVTAYAYNGRGELLSITDPVAGQTVYTYDGLGRQETSQNALNQLTVTTYDDANRKTIVKLANGLHTTQAWDAASRLITVSQGPTASSSTLGSTTHQYDGSGLRLMTTNPNGARSFNIYDDQYRLIGVVDGESTLTQYFYDAADRVTRTLQYANKVTTTAMGYVISGGQALSRPSIANVRPADNGAADRSSWNVYDVAGRLVKSADSEGAVAEYIYDGASLLLTTKYYASKITTGTLGNNPLATALAPTADTVNDRLARSFYDNDNKLIGTLDAEGWLRELKYDAGGRLTQKIAYGVATASVNRASGTFATLKTTALTTGPLLTTTYLYDQKGLLAGEIDPEGYFTESVYDKAGRITSSIRYVNKVTATYSGTSTVATMRPVLNTANDRTVTTEYDLLGRVKKIIAADGTVTTFTYDSVGNLITSLVALGTSDERTALAKRYDLQGRLVGELTSEGYSLLTVGMSQAQIDAVWAGHGITHAYDLAGRRTSTAEANRPTTTFTYDAEGRLKTQVVDSLTGGLQLTTQYAYDALGNLQTMTSPSGTVTTYGYDKLGQRVSEVVDAGGLNLQRTWAYDAAGRMVKETDRNATPTYSYYDRNGLLLATAQVTGSKLVGGVPQPTARVVQFAYDGYGRLVKTPRSAIEIDSVSAATTLATVQTKLTAAGNTSATDVVEHRVYDKDGRLTATVNGVGEVVKFWYDANGNVIDRIEYLNRLSSYTAGTDPSPTANTSGDHRLRTIYDKMGRATYAIDGTGAVVTYSYDRLGNLKERLAYATAVTTASYVAGTPLLPATNAADSKVRNTYDLANRLQWSVDGAGAVTRYYYDEDGQVVQTVAYLDTVTAAEQPTAAAATTGADRVSNFVYDKAGRLVYTVDSTGAVSRSIYNANGNVVQQAQYATRITAPTAGVILTSVTPPTASAADQITNFVYDKAGRVTYTVAGNGGVSRNIYDANGNVVQRVQYATAAAAPVAGTVIASLTPTTNAADRVTNYVYDAAGRVVYTVSMVETLNIVSMAFVPMGAVSRNYYDGRGNLIQQVGYATAIAAPVAGTPVTGVTPTANAAADRVTNFSYDKGGRLTLTVDATGAATHNVYDAYGNLVKQTRFGTSLAAPVAGTMPTGTLPSQSLTTDRVTRMAYDQAQRLVYTIDPSGAVSENVYDALSNVTSQVQRATRLTGTQMLAFDSTPTAATVKGPVTTNANAADRTTSFTYDAAGRTLTKTDPATSPQTFTYDGLGNKLTFKNEKNSVWSYQYDRVGRLTRETSPQVTVTTMTESGAAVTNNVAMVTDLVYDGLGNLKTRTESTSPAVTGQTRTTSYEYDALGRQTKTIFPSVGVYTAETNSALATNGAGGQASRSEASLALSSTTTYDMLGNATSSTDVGGKTTLKFYDKGGNLKHEVDALGYITEYLLNAFGEATQLKRYPTANTTLTVNSTITSSTTSSLGAARTLVTTYDKLGRVLSVAEPSVAIFDPTGTGGTRDYGAGKVTQNTYNVFGELVQLARIKNATASTWTNEYRYYNQLSQLVATVDAGGYLTELTYDVMGSVSSTKEWAAAVTGTVTTATKPTGAATAGQDREVTFTYDALNRKASETRKAVAFTDQETFVTSTADVTTSYAYDGVGNLVSTTTVDGTSFTYYDALGRITEIAGAVQGGGSSTRPLTSYMRDAFGNVTVEIKYAKGASAATVQSFTTGATVAADYDEDRVTRTAYDAAGHATYIESKTGMAAGANVYAAQQRFSYDAYGRVAKQWQTFTVDGPPSITRTIFQVNRYDALGRVVEVVTPGGDATIVAGDVSIGTPGSAVVSTTFTYNGFGEQLTRAVNAVTVETNQYDGAGRLWRTNAGDGVDKVYLYDQLGNRTADIRARGTAALGATVSIVAADTAVRRVDTYYDNLGRVVKQVLAPREEVYAGVTVRDGTANSNITSTRIFEGFWGEDQASTQVWTGQNTVTTSWDALGGLGAGEVKVQIDYFASEFNGTTSQWETNARSKSQVYESEASSTGVTMSLDASPTVSVDGGSAGAVVSISNIRVWKKDVNGFWVEVITPGKTGNVIEVDRASDMVNQVFQLDDLQDTAGYYTVAWSDGDWRDFGSRIALDWRDQDPARYRWQLVSKMADGTFQLTVSGNVSSQASTANGTGWTRPTVTQTVDRWGNVTSITDPRKAAWVTNYKYNASNQLIEVKQPVDVGGTITQQVSSTLYYDKIGRQVGIRDANGNLNRFKYDNLGNQIKEIHADNGIVDNWFNALGDKWHITDAMGNRDVLRFDTLGRQIRVDHTGQAGDTNAFMVYSTTKDASNNITVTGTGVYSLAELTTWDTAGRKLSTFNAASEESKYQYDLRGNIVKTTRPDGTVVTSAYDAQDRKIAETDGLGNTMTWTYNDKGQLWKHTNLGGAESVYTYHPSGDLAARTDPNGHRIVYLYDQVGQLAVATEYENTTTLVQQTRYTYDQAGRKTGEKVINRGVVYQDNHMAYDSLGRLRWVGDDHAQVIMEYDAQGNRKRVFTHVVNTAGLTDYSHDTDRYFLYDQMNRQKVVDAVDAAGNIGQQGHQLTYDANGNRKSDTFYGVKITSSTPQIASWADDTGSYSYPTGTYTYTSANGNVTESYRYDAADRLLTIERDGAPLDLRKYDKAGRVVQTGGEELLPDDYLRLLYGVDANGNTNVGNGVQRRTTHYENGRVVLQHVQRSDTTSTADEYRIFNDSFDAAGNLTNYRVVTNSSTSTYTNSFALLDGYKEASVSGTSSVLRPGNTTSSYDGNGFLLGVTDQTKPENNRTFINDVSGQIIATRQGARLLRQLTVNGEVLGQYGSGADQQTPREANGNARFDDDIADFQLTYRSISPSYPTASPGMYTIRSGDTLRSIAQQAYGDSRRWYQIAEANGIGSDSDLRVGQTLNLPNLVGGAGNAEGDFQPYDPAKVVGDTTPFMAQPKKKSNWFKQLIMIIIIVVATILTAGAAAGAMGTMVSTATGCVSAASMSAWAAGMAVMGGAGMGAAALGAAAIGAAVGSSAGQLVGMATGLQDKFSWKQVGLSALSAGVGAGVGSLANAGSLGSTLANNGTGAAIGRAALGNVAGQGIGVVTGLQKSFDWRGVAASAAGAGVGSAVGQGLQGTAFAQAFGDLGVRAASGFAGGLTAAVMRGGKIAIQQVAVDAFGNALGSSLADAMGPSDPMGDFINEKLAEQDRRDRYSLAGMGARLGPQSVDAAGGWSARVDQGITYAASQLPDLAPMSAEEFARRRLHVEDQVHLEILGQEAREASLNGAQLFMTGGARNGSRGIGSGGFETVRNGNWDAALNIGADPIGLLGELPGLKAQLGQLGRTQAEKRIESMRAVMLEGDVKGVPKGYVQSLVPGADGVARTVRDYGATLNELHTVYESHVRDQRLRDTWGDDYQNFRFGKSQMTVLELEKKVLDLQLKSADRAYAVGVDLIAKGELEISRGYATALGTFMDKEVRFDLRGMAKAEGINDSSMSNLWAINRRIKNDFGIGFPDNRLGLNMYADTTLARKSASTEQLITWNDIRPGHFVMIRPTQLGGAYVIPRTQFTPQPKPAGRFY